MKCQEYPIDTSLNDFRGKFMYKYIQNYNFYIDRYEALYLYKTFFKGKAF